MSYYDNTTQLGNYLSQNPDMGDVWGYIDAYLADAGLGDLNGWAKDLLVQYGQNLTDDMFKQQIRETQSYKTRFKAIELRKQAGLPPISEAEVIASERQMAQVLQQAGLPPTFYDSPEDFTNLIARDVSPQEFQQRIIDGYTAVRNNPAVQQELHRLYGVGINEGDLVAFFLDPDKATTALERRQSAATIASKSTQTGFGQLDTTQAERLAGQGITEAQAQQGFAQLAQQQSLLNPLASEAGSISTDTALSATFEGNADATQSLERWLQQRLSGFQGDGGYQVNRAGMTGAGSAK